MNGVLLGIGAYLLEMLKLFCIMHFVLRFEIKSRRWGILWVLGMCLPAGIMGSIGLLSPATYFSVLATVLIFKEKRRILYSIFSYFSISLFDSLCASIAMLILDVDYFMVGTYDVLQLLLNTISLVFLPFLVLVSYLWQKRKSVAVGRRIDRRWMVFVLIGEIAFSFFVQAFQFESTRDNRFGKGMAVALCVGSIVFVVALVVLIVSITTREHYKELAEMNECLLESQAEHYEMLLEKESETRAFRHDMKNHLYCMRSLLEDKDYKGLKSYFDTTGILLEQLRPTIQTGNEMVNVILNNVVGKYPTVSFCVEGIMSGDLGMENHDLCTIFFNLLENAFSAAEKAEEKQVSVCFTEREEMCFCVIRNTVLHPVEIRDNRMQTEKEDKKRHGYGTVNAVTCAEKNGGELRFSCEGKLFTAELLLFKAAEKKLGLSS